MQGNFERETESQQPRVSHPSEAGRRMKETGGKQKVSNKESVTLEEEPRNPKKTERQQQRICHPNKESVTPESYLTIYLI